MIPGKYVPPGQRAAVTKAMEEEKKKLPLDMGEESFPTLGGKPSTKTVWGTEKKSYTDTIHGLIALEQRTAEERELAEEERRKNLGTVSLKLPKTFESARAIAEHLDAMSRAADYEWQQMELGLSSEGGWCPTPPHSKQQDASPLETSIHKN